MSEFELLRVLTLGLILVCSLTIAYLAYKTNMDWGRCSDALEEARDRIILLEHENFELRVEKEFNEKKEAKADQK